MSDPRVLIVTAMRNEAPYVVDWVAHVRSMGAAEVLVYSNDCDDGTGAVLDALAAAGEVVHVRHSPPRGESVQWHAFRAAWKHPLRKACDWALVCDVDEFVNIRVGGFAELIGALPAGTDAVALPWRLMGAVPGRALDVPVPDSSPMGMNERLSYPLAATLFKALFRLDGPFNQFGIHRPSQKKDAVPRWVDGSGAAMPDAFARRVARLSLFGMPRGRALADIHHYSLRSPMEFLLKRERGLPNTHARRLGLDYWVERNFASTPAPLTLDQAERARLMAVPGVAKAHDAGIAWHRARQAALLATAEGEALHALCRLSGASAELTDHEAGALYAQYRGANQV